MNPGKMSFSVGLDQFDLELERLRRCKDTFVQKILQSLKHQGQLAPVVVTERQQRLLMIDGFKRYRAAEMLGWSCLNAVSVEVDMKKAKAMLYVLNRSGCVSMLHEALLVAELIENEGLTQNEVGILMDHHRSWVSRRLEMIRRLSPEIIDALLLELIPPGAGPSLARVPQCNQPDFYATIVRHRFSSAQIAKLADIYCKAPSPDMKQMVLASAGEALSIVSKKQKEDRPSQQVFEQMIVLVDDVMADKTIPAGVKDRIRRIKIDLADILEQINKENICVSTTKKKQKFTQPSGKPEQSGAPSVLPG